VSPSLLACSSTRSPPLPPPPPSPPRPSPDLGADARSHSPPGQSLHVPTALEIPLRGFLHERQRRARDGDRPQRSRREPRRARQRSEEHTSELQSLTNLVCRLLLEKKKNRQTD